MQRAADAVGFEMFLQLVALRMTHHVEMPDAFAPTGFLGQLQRRVVQQFVIAMRDTAATGGPVRQVLELYAEDGALDSFHAVIEADFVVVVALSGAVLSQGASARGQCAVIRDESAAFAIST